MLIGFVGDVHGRVFQALALLATWQVAANRQFDFIIQVGDMGAFPDASRMDDATRRYLAVDPAEADFGRLLQADDSLAEGVRRVRTHLAGPVYFLRGNHEDVGWLRAIPMDATGTAAVDRLGLLRYVPDGTVLERAGVRVAFLGGVETSEPRDDSLDEAAYARLLAMAPGSFDVLVTHDAPYGVAVGYGGQTQGSAKLSRLVEAIRPRWWVAGHLHHIIGPQRFGATTYLGLSSLVASARWQPGRRGLLAGCLAVPDTVGGDLLPVTDDWLAVFPTPFQFESWAVEFGGV